MLYEFYYFPRVLFFNLQRKVDLDPHLGNLVFLGFQPVNMAFLILQDGGEQVTRAVIEQLPGLGDGRIVVRYRSGFGFCDRGSTDLRQCCRYAWG